MASRPATDRAMSACATHPSPTTPDLDASDEYDPTAPLTAQTLNADGTPKRPMNAFMIFARKRRPEISATNAALRTGEISKVLSKEWSSMPAADKLFFQEQARKLKDHFNSKYPDYVYRRRPNHSRRRRRGDPDAAGGDEEGRSPSADSDEPSPVDERGPPPARAYAYPDPYARTGWPAVPPLSIGGRYARDGAGAPYAGAYGPQPGQGQPQRSWSAASSAGSPAAYSPPYGVPPYAGGGGALYDDAAVRSPYDMRRPDASGPYDLRRPDAGSPYDLRRSDTGSPYELRRPAELDARAGGPFDLRAGPAPPALYALEGARQLPPLTPSAPYGVYGAPQPQSAQHAHMAYQWGRDVKLE